MKEKIDKKRERKKEKKDSKREVELKTAESCSSPPPEASRCLDSRCCPSEERQGQPPDSKAALETCPTAFASARRDSLCCLAARADAWGPLARSFLSLLQARLASNPGKRPSAGCCRRSRPYSSPSFGCSRSGCSVPPCQGCTWAAAQWTIGSWHRLAWGRHTVEKISSGQNLLPGSGGLAHTVSVTLRFSFHFFACVSLFACRAAHLLAWRWAHPKRPTPGGPTTSSSTRRRRSTPTSFRRTTGLSCLYYSGSPQSVSSR